MPETKKANSKGKSSKFDNKYKKSLDEGANITVRLSDVGDIKRTPSEIELHIQSGTISAILDEAIQKAQIALCLPYFLKNNAEALRPYLPKADVEFIQKASLKCGRSGHIQLSQHSSIFQTSVSKNTIDKITISELTWSKVSCGIQDLDLLIDPHMSKIMEILWKSRGLKYKVFDDFKEIADLPSKGFLQALNNLKKVAEEKLAVTASEQRAYTKRLRNAWQANYEAEESMAKLKIQIKKQNEALRAEAKAKQAILREYMDRIDLLEMTFHQEAAKKVTDSEKAMVAESSISALRQADLAYEAKTTTQQYETLLSQHIHHENSLRAKCIKAETQLSSWLAKYDTDIGDRLYEYEEILKNYEDEKEEVKALKKLFDEQEEEYEVLMREKAAMERRVWEEKAATFLANYAAKKIQRFYHYYKAKVMEKKKSRKSKKGEAGKKKLQVIETLKAVEAAASEAIKPSAELAGVTDVKMDKQSDV